MQITYLLPISAANSKIIGPRSLVIFNLLQISADCQHRSILNYILDILFFLLFYCDDTYVLSCVM